MAIQNQRPVRTESAARWEKALARALANSLDVYQVADTGERMVTSASQFDTLHRTDGRDCTCAAGVAGDPVCQHRDGGALRDGVAARAIPFPHRAGRGAGCRARASVLLVPWLGAHPERL